ncbi:hypothetical protein HHI36_005188 [Cryptolaemus montrouzieri]|uniref:Uncharacterized protein n=1 Tax=Cryptolaemus montrouzieri TaxID=559131 RepID=A0ABD2NTL3_9CUCU
MTDGSTPQKNLEFGRTAKANWQKSHQNVDYGYIPSRIPPKKWRESSKQAFQELGSVMSERRKGRFCLLIAVTTEIFFLALSASSPCNTRFHYV